MSLEFLLRVVAAGIRSAMCLGNVLFKRFREDVKQDDRPVERIKEKALAQAVRPHEPGVLAQALDSHRRFLEAERAVKEQEEKKTNANKVRPNLGLHQLKPLNRSSFLRKKEPTVRAEAASSAEARDDGIV